MRRLWLVLSLFSVLLVFGLISVDSASAADATPGAGETLYTVVANDTLFALSIRFHTTVSAIASRNGIANVNLIFIGEKLVIPAAGGSSPTPTPSGPTATPKPGATPTPTTPPSGTTTYIVRAGDTLGGIAARFGTTVHAIAVLNGILNPNLIHIGQTLIISGSGGNPTPSPTPNPGSTPAPTPAPIQGSFELGGHVLSFAYPQLMHSAGMTWAKIQIIWGHGQPASIVQGAVNAAHGNGFKVLLSIVGNPSEMGTNLTSYYQDFASFLGSVASTYHPEAIEVWNEPNIDREWPAGKISPAGYTQMLHLAYTAIKAGNAATMVISAAPAPTGFFGGGCSGAGCDDAPFERAIVADGAKSYADCIGIHYNEGIISPDATSGDTRGNPNFYTRYYHSMVNTYVGIFGTKQLCFTELGYLTPQGLGPLPASFAWAANTTIQQQADWLARATTLSRQNSHIRLEIIWNVDATSYTSDDPQAGYAIVRSGGSCTACAELGTAMQ